MAIRILICDDHPVVRAGLQGMLAGQTDFVVVGEASDGTEALAQVAALAPDVVLMDLRMPGRDGTRATTAIRVAYPSTRVLVLTTYDSDVDIVRAVEAGAAGYMLKDAPREELFRAIRAAARGEAPFAPAVALRLVSRLRTPTDETLSPRELEVLNLVAQGASNRAIGKALHISEATVKSHLIHIFSKLGVDDRTAAVTAAVRRGLLRLEARD